MEDKLKDLQCVGPGIDINQQKQLAAKEKARSLCFYTTPSEYIRRLCSSRCRIEDQFNYNNPKMRTLL